MRPLIWSPLRSQFYADNGVELFVNGNFETAGGPPPVGWTAFQTTATRELGTRPGGLGSWVGRAAYDGANANGLIYQVLATVGRRYHASGWLQGINGAVPFIIDNGSATSYWTGVAGPWQQADAVFNALGTQLRLQSTNLAATRYIEADDMSLQEQFMYTQNIGSAGNLQCGDGRTAATFPTMLTPAISLRKGMNFDGQAASNQRLVAVGQLLGTGDITVVLQSIQRTAGFASWARLVSNAVAAGFDLSLVWDGTHYHIYVTSNAFTTIFDTIFDAYMRLPTTIIVTRTAGVTGTCLYVNGKLINTGNSGVAQAGDANLTIGSYPDAGVAQRPMDAELLHASVWPFLFTPQQASLMHQRLLAELSI